MTVTANLSRIVYTADGTTDTFTVPFRFLHANHLRVTESQLQGQALLTEGVHYSVAGVNQPSGGAVVMASAPAAGRQITITRVVPITQETVYPKNDPFPEAAHEQALDKLTMIAQQLAEAVAQLTAPAAPTFERTVIVSTQPPSGGADGDVWFQVNP